MAPSLAVAREKTPFGLLFFEKLAIGTERSYVDYRHRKRSSKVLIAALDYAPLLQKKGQGNAFW